VFLTPDKEGGITSHLKKKKQERGREGATSLIEMLKACKDIIRRRKK